jgi:rieske iron-sulfur protein
LDSLEQRAGRRTILRAGLGLGISACFACQAEAQDNPAAARPKEGDLLVKFGDATNTPLTPGDVPAGSKQIFAWSMDPSDKTVRSGSRLNRILLVRLEPEKLVGETKARSAEGVVAYSSICPHNGCDVNEWVAADQTLFCACHASKFEPRDAGKVLDGPSPNPLPALPLKVTDGKLVVAKPFTSRITFEQG